MRKFFQVTRISGLGLAALALLGCEAANQKFMSVDESSAGSYPAAYRTIARDHFQKTLFDPYSVQDAQISKPKMGKLFVENTLGVYEPGWIVCFRSNAKNRMGAYTGVSDTAIVIRGDRVMASLSDPTHSQFLVKTICDDEKYEPFMEIEQQMRSPAAR